MRSTNGWHFRHQQERHAALLLCLQNQTEKHACKKLNVRKEAAEHEIALRLKTIVLQPNVVEWMIDNVLRFQEEARKQSDLASYQDRLVEVKRSLTT